MKFKKYPKYKNSKTEWLGSIPEQWSECRLKHCVKRFIGGGTPASNDDNNWTTEEDGTPWVAIADMTNQDLIEITEKKVTKKGLIEKNLKILPSGTLLYSMYASLGKVSELGVDAVTNQAILGVLHDEKIIAKHFLQYWLKYMENHVVLLSSSNTQDNLNAEKVKNMPIFIPEIDVQLKVCTWLDTETTKTDSLIKKYQDSIKLIQEKRLALITHAVTKGLNPKAKMKDSGVEWIGKIQEHWKVQKIKYFCDINPSKSEIKIGMDEKVSFLAMESVSEEGVINLDEQKPIEELYQGFTYFRDGDVIVAKITPCFENGKGALLHDLTNGVGFGSTEFHVIRPRRQQAISSYIYYLTKTHVFMTTGKKFMKGVAGQQRVPTEFIKDFLIGRPSVEEQVEIVKFIDKETATIDRLTETIKKQVELLQEYKTSLISHAVTGEIDVRGLV